MNDQTRAIILAAGRGSRMQGLTEDQPKCLNALGGKPLIRWQTDAVEQAGIDQISVVTGYRHDALRDFGLDQIHNPRWQSAEMVVSLMCAHHLLAARPCIVSYSDNFYAPEAVSLLTGSGADIAITYDPNWRDLWSRRFENPLDDAETFSLNRDGTVRDIGGKPSDADEIQGQYMGLLYFTPSGWTRVLKALSGFPDKQIDGLSLTALLAHLIASGERIAAVPYNGRWGEVDSEYDLRLYENLYFGGRL